MKGLGLFLGQDEDSPGSVSETFEQDIPFCWSIYILSGERTKTLASKTNPPVN